MVIEHVKGKRAEVNEATAYVLQPRPIEVTNIFRATATGTGTNVSEVNMFHLVWVKERNDFESDEEAKVEACAKNLCCSSN